MMKVLVESLKFLGSFLVGAIVAVILVLICALGVVVRIPFEITASGRRFCRDVRRKIILLKAGMI